MTLLSVWTPFLNLNLPILLKKIASHHTAAAVFWGLAPDQMHAVLTLHCSEAVSQFKTLDLLVRIEQPNRCTKVHPLLSKFFLYKNTLAEQKRDFDIWCWLFNFSGDLPKLNWNFMFSSQFNQRWLTFGCFHRINKRLFWTFGNLYYVLNILPIFCT